MLNYTQNQALRTHTVLSIKRLFKGNTQGRPKKKKSLEAHRPTNKPNNNYPIIIKGTDITR